MSVIRHLSWFVLGILCCGSAAHGLTEQSFVHKSFDGFSLSGKIAVPNGKPKGVVVLLGGSGPYDMDLDLTLASKDKKTKILWLKAISDALVGTGFATVRTNKRPFEMRKAIIAARKAGKKALDPALKAAVTRFQKNPLKHYVDDAKSVAGFARKRFPGVKVYILGGSEGTNVGLWAAHELGWISGVALIGFYAVRMDNNLLEQMIYRQLRHFRKIDSNHDDLLSQAELKAATGHLAFGLLFKFGSLDLDGDNQISIQEFKATIAVHLLKYVESWRAYRLQEAKYPSMYAVLKAATFKVAFLQGLWDNQTQPYNTMALQHLASDIWKKGKQFSFTYFPKSGHCLDPRDDYYDLYYRKMTPDALKKVASTLARVFAP